MFLEYIGSKAGKVKKSLEKVNQDFNSLLDVKIATIILF